MISTKKISNFFLWHHSSVCPICGKFFSIFSFILCPPFAFVYVFVIVAVVVVFFGLQLWHMEVPRLGLQSKLQLPAYATATAMWDLSCVCKLLHSSWQCQVLNPVSEAKDQTCIPHGYQLGSLPLSHNGNCCIWSYKFHLFCLCL